MGGTMDQAASRVMKMSKAALENNSRLLVEMGGYDAVAGALANFSGMLTKAGIDTVAIQGQLAGTSSKYLESLKMIEAITGQTAKEQQKEQEEALKNVAFQRKLREVAATEGPEAAAAMLQTLNEVSATMGKSGADYYKELAATGRVISENNLQYRAFGPAYAKTIEGMNANRIAYGKDTEGRLKANAETLRANKGAIEANLKATAGVDSLAYAVKDGMVPVIGQFNNDVLVGTEKRDNFLDATTKAIADQKKREGQASEGAAKGTVALNKTQMDMDKRTQSQIGKMGDLVVTLNDLQVKLMDTFGPKLTTAVDMFAKGIKKIAEQLGIQAAKDLSEAIKSEIETPGEVFNPATQQMEIQAAQRSKVGAATKGATALTSGAKAGAGTVKVSASDLSTSGLKLASADVMAPGAEMDASTIRAAGIVQDLLGAHFGGVTGMNDKYHQGLDNNSYHKTGQAFDFVTSPKPSSPEDGEAMIQMIKSQLGAQGLKVKEIIDEYNKPSANAKGSGHFHIALEKLAKGGITNGVSIAGEAGPEAVVPLPDGRTIPVRMDTGELVDKLQEMIDVMKEQRDNSEKLLWANS